MAATSLNVGMCVQNVRKWWKYLALLVSGIVGVLYGYTDAGAGTENFLRGLAWQVRTHDASGTLHIVEIDARSIAAIDRWPWPRGNHAQLVDRLRAAGAASIAFDVDFSSRSQPREDATFARALERPGAAIILPTFGQFAGGRSAGWIESLPIPELRKNATLAAVSILPGRDGYVRRAPVGMITAGVARPSLSVAIAERNGAVGRDFPIDFAIDPATIPRHSFIDIRDGHFDPREIAGKRIIVGATAVEIGDRYAVPNYGVVPGVVIQALAAETLRDGVPREGGWELPFALAIGFAAATLWARSRGRALATMLAGPIVMFGVAVMAQDRLHLWLAITPAMVTMTVASGVAGAARWIERARRTRSHDTDTGLPNRRALREFLKEHQDSGIAAARIAEFDKLVVGLGAAGAAELVTRVCERIALIAEGAIVYRIEDRLLAWPVGDPDHLEDRFAGLRAAMISPIVLAGRRVDVNLALGFAMAANDPGRTLANAAMAADQALVSGAGWHFHAAEEEAELDREMSLLGELDEAVSKHEIEVYYQPKLDLKTNRVVSVEALVRWNHGTRGFLSPGLFIPLAERNNRIAALTLEVLAQTIRDVLRWHADGHMLTAAVNLSAKLLGAADFIAGLREIIARSGIDPALLTFEVTESATLDNPETAIATLRSFRALGVGISMDDYGTGQSTLSYIKQLPLTELKIDRSFVQFAHQNRGDRVLVRSTVDLAHELGLKVVAEGVEDAECLALLTEIGCDMAQGYFVSVPLSRAALEQFLTKRVAVAA